MSKRDDLRIQINAEASKYLGFQTEICSSGRTVKELETALNKLQWANQLAEKAKMIKSKYTTQQWDAAIIFGVGKTDVSQGDLELVNLCLKLASNLWQSNLWKKE